MPELLLPFISSTSHSTTIPFCDTTPTPKNQERKIMSLHALNLLLPESFQPSDTEVVVGRGKRCAEHPGNKRLREIVQAHVPEYAKTSTKREKTHILNTVVRLVRSNSAQQAGFVRENKATGRWNIVEDSAARITTAQVFRDALHTHYK